MILQRWLIFQVLLLLTLFNQVFAHSGYNLITKDLELSDYQISIYEDTHLLENKPQLSLFIKVSQNKQVPSEAPLLRINLDQNQHFVLKENFRDVGIATDNGSLLYQAYILESTIPETGFFDAVLTLETTDTLYSYPFKLNAQIQADFRFIELIPSLLFIFIPMFGLAFIFLSPLLSRKEIIYAKQTSFNHS